jgi:uncharacterized protein YndB with AHSA1/START domain
LKKIIHYVHINAPTPKVFSALTTDAGLSGWWSTNVKVEPGLGGVIDFTFVDDFNPNMQVTKLETDRWVEWKCISGHDNWQDNTFSFELRASGEATDLMFIQVYAQELSDEVYGTYNFNWGYYLGSLQQLCETGQGTPFQASE